MPDTLGGPLAVRERIFEMAGLDVVKQSELVTAAVRAAEAALEAVHTEYLVVPGAKGEGAKVEAHESPDHATRLRASDQIFSLVNAYPSRSSQAAQSSAAGQIVNVNVTLKDMSPGQNALPTAQIVPTERALDGTYRASASKPRAT